MAEVYLSLGLALIAFATWAAWQRGVVGWIGRIAIVLAAATATAAALAFLALGERMHWRSEGPGILLVWIGLPLFALIAFGLWTLAVAAFVRWRVVRRRDRAAPASAPKPPRLVGTGAIATVVLLCLAAAALAWLGEMRDKPAHDAAIAAVRFADGADAMYSIDVAGVLKVWKLRALPRERDRRDHASPYGLSTRIRLPQGKAPHDLRVANGGHRVALIDDAGVTIVDIEGDRARPVERIDGASLAATHEAGFVVAAPEGLRWIVPGAASPRRAMPWPQRVVALDAHEEAVAFADATGVVTVTRASEEARTLGAAPFQVASLSFTGDGRSVVVADGKGRAAAFGLDAEGSRAMQGMFGSVVGPQHGGQVLVCALGYAECRRIDAASGRGGAAFSGIAKRYDHADSVPGAAAIASGNEIFVVTLAPKGYQQGFAYLKDRRF